MIKISNRNKANCLEIMKVCIDARPSGKCEDVLQYETKLSLADRVKFRGLLQYLLKYFSLHQNGGATNQHENL